MVFVHRAVSGRGFPVKGAEVVLDVLLDIDDVIEHYGKKKILKKIGIHDILANLSAAELRELKRREPRRSIRGFCAVVSGTCFASLPE